MCMKMVGVKRKKWCSTLFIELHVVWPSKLCRTLCPWKEYWVVLMLACLPAVIKGRIGSYQISLESQDKKSSIPIHFWWDYRELFIHINLYLVLASGIQQGWLLGPDLFLEWKYLNLQACPLKYINSQLLFNYQSSC